MAAVVLITGIRGFVGSHLSSYLAAAGHEVIGVSRRPDPARGIFSWDDMRHDRLPRIDAIIHAAAIAHDTDGKIPEEHYQKVNVGLTRLTYDYFCSHASVGTYIFVSSIAATQASMRDAYGRSKASAEQYIADNSERSRDRRVVVLRPAMIYGEGNKGNLPLLFNVLRRGLPWPLGAFKNTHSFVYIDNFCHVVSRMIERREVAGTFAVADDTPISTTRIVTLAAEATGRKARLWHIPKPMVITAAKIGDALRLPLNSRRLGKLSCNLIVDNTALKQALSITAMPVATEEAFRRTFAAMAADCQSK
ncbi:MAG: NAD-dependent epimerase/dehydratase family protein [Muribaculaceae bacterium]